MSIDQEELQTVMAECRQWLESHQAWLVTAESITGGGLGAAWTSQSGSSKTYLGGITAYQNEIKEKLLGVPHDLLETYSAVSEEVAAAMLKGLWSVFSQATIGIAVTGYAEGGKNPGLVWVAIGAREQHSTVVAMQGTGDRESVRKQTCLFAYQSLWQYIATDNDRR